MKIIKISALTMAACGLCLLSLLNFTACKKDTVVKIDTLYDVRDGLLAYYNFNGGSLHDSSGYHNDITFNNATLTTDRFGIQNNAYLFNGSSSYMRIPANRSLNTANITLMAYFKLNGFYTGICHGNEILSKGTSDGNDGNYLLRCNDISAPCNVAPNNNNQTFAGGIYGANSQIDTVFAKLGQWYQLAYTYDGFNVKLYLNGELKKNIVTSVDYTFNGNDLFLGKHESDLYPYYLNGVIDEVRIYNRALSIGAIRQLYKAVQ